MSSTSTAARQSNVRLPSELTRDEAITLAGYQRAVHATDKLPRNDLSMPIFGLFGEVGSLLAVLKKKSRDAAAYTAYDSAIVEELGDVLWYLTCIVHRAGFDLSAIAEQIRESLTTGHDTRPKPATFRDLQHENAQGGSRNVLLPATELAKRAGELVGDLHDGAVTDHDRLSPKLVTILHALLAIANVTDTDLETAARRNLEKTFSRWPLQITYPELADSQMPQNEQLPRHFEMFVEEHQITGKTYVLQKCNGVIVGDRLTDNKAEQDDYRFHDVFHIAYAVHLGWSPTLRALFHVKRKSAPNIDESEDGARAVLIEEGVATFIFGRALERHLFDELDHLDLDLLKLVQGLVRGFEPEQCALWQWERAILDGFRMFRALKRHRRGVIKADLLTHTLVFEPISGDPPAR